LTIVKINRAPVLTLWGVIVAEALGHSRATALTFGKYVAGKGAFAKAKRLGLAEDREPGARKRSPDDPVYVLFMGAEVPVVETKAGPRAIQDGKPIEPAAVERYLTQKFGDNLDAIVAAMKELAKSRAKAALAREAFGLYEQFRPAIPAGVQGWGKAGEMDLAMIKKLARS
jgi:hypothetical protein